MGAKQSVGDFVTHERRAELGVRRDLPGLIFLSGHLAVLGTTGYLLFLALGSYWVVHATLLHGFVLVHLFAPFHECSHGTPFRTRGLNQAVFWLTGLALFLPPLHFRLEHAAHHAYTSDPARDPEMIPMASRLSGFLLYGTAIPYFRGLLRRLTHHPLGLFTEVERRFIPAHSRRRVQRQAWIMWAGYLGIALASLWFESSAALVYWVIPRLVGEPFQRFIRMTEHVGCPSAPNMLENTRTTLTWTPLRWLAWNMPYHAEHHVVSSVPFHALPALHDELKPHLAMVAEGYLAAERDIVRKALAARRADMAAAAGP